MRGWPLLERLSTVARMHKEVLDNGLRVLIQEMHTTPLASVWCWYRVGSKDETTGQTGVSHWVEHMNFKGTTNIPREKVKGIIEQFGGYWNGYTWIDQTAYTQKPPHATRSTACCSSRPSEWRTACTIQPIVSRNARSSSLSCKGRERSGHAVRPGTDRDGLYGAFVPTSHNWLALGSPDDDPG